MERAQKPDLVFRRNWRVHLNRWGRQFSWLLAGDLCTSACRVCTARASVCSAVMWRLLVTHSILLFPLHFSARASRCAITFQMDLTVLLRIPSIHVQFVIDDQKDANFLYIYLYPISSTYFGGCFCPSSGALDCIYSIWYSPPTLLPAGAKFHLVHDTGRHQQRWTISEALNTVNCSWWWVKTSPKHVELIGHK